MELILLTHKKQIHPRTFWVNLNDHIVIVKRLGCRMTFFRFFGYKGGLVAHNAPSFFCHENIDSSEILNDQWCLTTLLLGAWAILNKTIPPYMEVLF